MGHRREHYLTTSLIGATLCFACLTGAARADWSFNEGFNGGFSNTWNPTPDGAPQGTFTTFAGAQVYRMTNQLNMAERRGLVSPGALQGATGVLEARFNTVVQDATHIDGLLQLNIVRPNASVLGGVHLFSGGFSNPAGKKVLMFAPFESAEFFYNYPDNTWFRFRWESSPDILRASFLTDDGQVIFSRDFATRLNNNLSYGVGIEQFMGGPNGLFTDVALDSVTAVPAPSTGLLLAVAALSSRRRRR